MGIVRVAVIGHVGIAIMIRITSVSFREECSSHLIKLIDFPTRCFTFLKIQNSRRSNLNYAS